MRFTFGPTHKVSLFMYALGIPVVLMTAFDRFLEWHFLEPTINLQLFFAGAILVTIGGVINISMTIVQNFKR